MPLARPLLLLLVLLQLPIVALAGESRRLTATPRITAVTVYPDRAMTTRSATFKLKPGNWILSLEPLPVLMQDDSIRVEGKGTAAAAIVGTEVKTTFVEQSSEKRAQELDEAILKAERSVGSVDARKAALAAQKGFIDSVRVAWGDRISKEIAIGKPTAAELNEALAFVGNGVTSVEEKMRDLDEEKKKLKDKIEALRKTREQAIGSGRKEVKSLDVAVEVTREGNLTLDVAGVVPQAGWEPSYDVRLASDGQSAELLFRGEVQQQTGEDWTEVDLALSTARPAVGGAPPELTPWHVSFYEPRPMPTMALKSLARESMMMRRQEMDEMAPAAAASAPAPAPVAHRTAQVSEEQSSMLFRISRPADVPSDGALHGNVVAVEKLPVSLQYFAVPKKSPHVFLKSEIENRAAYPLLPGKLNVFTGGNFIGSSQLKKVAAGEKFDLFFGSDDQVTVKREELKRHKEGGLFGKSRMAYRYRIEVNNFRKEPRTVVIRDQLPLAENEEIKVSLDEPSLKPDEVKEDGTLTWKLVLKPGEKREISYGIVIEYPKDKEIIGL